MSPEETALLQATTYHRKVFDHIAFRSPPREERRVQPYIVDPFLTTPTSPPSFLGRLPHELLREICLDLDIQSLFRLRQVNQLTRLVVSSLSEYQAISRHALDALRASLLTRMARYQTLSDIYDPLREPLCAFCWSFGSFLFLPTAQRCCYSCLDSSSFLTVKTMSHMQYASYMEVRGRPSQFDKSNPSFRIIPGSYTRDSIRVHFRSGLSVLRLGETRYKGLAPYMRESYDERHAYTYSVSTAFPYLDRGAVESFYGLACKGCLRLERWNREVKELEALCGSYRRNRQEVKACRELWNEVYSREGVLEHVRQCKGAQRLWRATLLKEARKDVKPDKRRKSGKSCALARGKRKRRARLLA